MYTTTAGYAKEISLQDKYNDNIDLRIKHEHFSVDEEINFENFERMSREEAIDYLYNMENIEDFDCIKISATLRVERHFRSYSRILDNGVNSKELKSLFQMLADTLQRTAVLYQTMKTESRKKAEDELKQQR